MSGTMPDGHGDPGVTYRPIPGRPGYCAGDDGSIWRVSGPAPRKRKLTRMATGRLYVAMRPGIDQVSRLVLTAFVGPCPPGLVGCHTNGDPLDNRPANLRWDTQKSNMDDRRRHGRDKGVLGERNANAKITAAVAVEMVTLASQGWGIRALARRFGVGQTTAERVVKGQTWSHATGLPRQPVTGRRS